jgi:hypothetical protein
MGRMVAILAVLALSREVERGEVGANYVQGGSFNAYFYYPSSNSGAAQVYAYLFHCANLEALAALDEGVGDAEEPVVTEVQHAQELQVLKLASREHGREVVPQLVVTVGQGEQVQSTSFVL